MPGTQRRILGTAAALAALLAALPVGAQIADGGATGDAAAVTTASVDTAGADAGVAFEMPIAPVPPAVTASQVATMMLATPTQVDAEPPRPITRRLWFWMALSGVVVGAVVLGIALHNPNHTRPECPADYVCPP